MEIKILELLITYKKDNDFLDFILKTEFLEPKKVKDMSLEDFLETSRKLNVILSRVQLLTFSKSNEIRGLAFDAYIYLLKSFRIAEDIFIEAQYNSEGGRT